MAINKPTKKKKPKISRGERSIKLRQDANTTAELLPCPFCAGRAVAYETPWGVGVSCKSCKADGPAPPVAAPGSLGAVVKLWNKRR